jgi:hypothetical protein
MRTFYISRVDQNFATVAHLGLVEETIYTSMSEFDIVYPIFVLCCYIFGSWAWGMEVPN